MPQYDPTLPAFCEQFAQCTNHATHTRPHPILGQVPTCERCADKLDSFGTTEERNYDA